jgi:hypothetical protein
MWDYVQLSRRPRGMSSGGVGECGACPFFAARTGLMWDHVQPSHAGGGMTPGKAADRAGRAQLGEAGKFRYSSICF